MLMYLTREKRVDDHWYPENTRDQARVDEYMEWKHLNIRKEGMQDLMNIKPAL